jgi:hypothetical protein
VLPSHALPDVFYSWRTRPSVAPQLPLPHTIRHHYQLQLYRGDEIAQQPPRRHCQRHGADALLQSLSEPTRCFVPCATGRWLRELRVRGT